MPSLASSGEYVCYNNNSEQRQPASKIAKEENKVV